VSLVFKNNPQGNSLRLRPNSRWWNCVQTDINKFTTKNWNRIQKNRAAEKSIK